MSEALLTSVLFLYPQTLSDQHLLGCWYHSDGGNVLHIGSTGEAGDGEVAEPIGKTSWHFSK